MNIKWYLVFCLGAGVQSFAGAIIGPKTPTQFFLTGLLFFAIAAILHVFVKKR